MNIHIYPSPIIYESRIFKITKSLVDLKIFEKIIIIGTLENNLPEFENLDDNRLIVRIKRRSNNRQGNLFIKLLYTIEWSINVFLFLNKYKISCINCHSLPILLLCIILKYKHKAKLVYDTHELETETSSMTKLSKLLLKKTEKLLINYVDIVFVVSDQINEWYIKNYNKQHTYTIYNYPTILNINPDKKYFSETFKLHKDSIIFIYLGILEKNRFIEHYLNVFSNSPSKNIIIFIGYGELKNRILEYSQKYQNIHYHKAINSNLIPKYCSSADIGLMLLPTHSLSFKLSMPNKINEYILSNIPFISNLHNEYSVDLVNKYNCGWIINNIESEFSVFINSISKEEINQKKENVKKMKNIIDWNINLPLLKEKYSALLIK